MDFKKTNNELEDTKEIIAKDSENTYQDYIARQIDAVSNGASVSWELCRAEPDFLAAPEPNLSPELQAIIEVIQDGGLKKLSAIQQKVFQLSIVEGLTTRKVAKELKIKSPTVVYHLNQIKKILRPLAEEKL